MWEGQGTESKLLVAQSIVEGGKKKCGVIQEFVDLVEVGRQDDLS